ncbi:glycosyltransferase family 2 protein [Polynucleobacter sp. 15G-AUS-farblos]|uniref:glycosyltransferase family A protein n=1 Tax=Polynucleobacter sp. 15G-AUS-farblos TaxID=2689094 RepID=UPI001C0DCB09|nr:glycosyltransferase family 2 protein [Polynucleobacter sp. 15G-AUS-farblos]
MNKKSIKIQFVIPAYGDSPYIEECIKTLLSQALADQISIATSTPSTFLDQLAFKYGLKINVNPHKNGIANDWNFALKQKDAKFDLIVIAHQDDLYETQFSKRVTSFFRAHSDVGIVFTDCAELIQGKTHFNSKREIVKKLLRRLAFFGAATVNTKMRYRFLLGFGCSIPCPTVIFNSSRLVGFEFSGQYSVNLDWAAWLSIAKRGVKIGYIPSSLVVHRIHDSAETQNAIVDQRRSNEDLLIFEGLWPKSFAKLLMMIYQFGYK